MTDLLSAYQTTKGKEREDLVRSESYIDGDGTPMPSPYPSPQKPDASDKPYVS
jgi:hypothetical protein